MISDTPSAAWTTPELGKSSTNGSPPKKRALRTCGVFGGLRASDAQSAKGRRPVPRPEVNSSA